MDSKKRVSKSVQNTLEQDILSVLLIDRTKQSMEEKDLLRYHMTGKNIIWATEDYSYLGSAGYSFSDSIQLAQITGENGAVIKPRVQKDKDSQTQRSKNKAEVFTPSWVCNAQNNLIDDAWFGKHANRFNKELETTWVSTYARKNPEDRRGRIRFPNKPGKTWKDYVSANRLEVSCGEAPYLTSRYDTVTGKSIRPKNRIGLLDRKLRVITENTEDTAEWLYWAEKALQSIYGFEWQGDSLLLARENILLAVVEAYDVRFHRPIEKERLLQFAEIISWNIWQMDGIKFVIPNTCHDEIEIPNNFFDTFEIRNPCPGCKNGDRMQHNGLYARIMDWEKGEPVRFADIPKGVR